MDFEFRKLLLLLGDVVILYGTLFLTLFLRFFGDFDLNVFLSHATAFTFLYGIWFIVFSVMDFYDLRLVPESTLFLSRLGATLFVLFATGVTYFYATSFSGISPKTNLIIHILLFGAFAFLWRVLFSRVVSPLVPWRIGILEETPQMAELKQLINAHGHLGYTCVMVSTRDRSLESAIEQERLHALVLPVGTLANAEVAQEFYKCLGTGVTFFEPTQVFEMFARRIPLSTIDHHWFIRSFQDRQRGFSFYAKRLFDVVTASLVLLFTAPIFLCTALLILFEDGIKAGVFYTQERVGKNGEVFRMRKFRTMHKDAEQGGAQWAQKHDERVTRVGKWLRCTHIDELPQMMNVLRGEISFVGPRPERPEFVARLEQEIPHYRIRHLIKPGFTGWAQINYRYARSVADSKEKFEYDLYYLKNQSVFLDFLILFKTTRLLFYRET